MTRTSTLLSAVMAVLLIGMVAWLRPADDPKKPLHGLPRRIFWRQLLLAEGHHDIVLAGDSRVSQAIVPGILADELQRSVLSLAFASVAFEASYFDHVEARIAPGGCVLVGVAPRQFTEKAVTQSAFNRWRGEKVHTVWWADGWLRYFSGRLRPLSWAEVRAMSGIDVPGVIIEMTYHQSGWIEARVPEPDPTHDLARYKAWFAESPVEQSWIDRFISRVAAWRAAGITVVGLRLPVSPQMRAVEDQMSGLDWGDLVRRFGAAGGIWLSDFSAADYPTYDGNHVDGTTARRLSVELAARLRSVLPQSPSPP